MLIEACVCHLLTDERISQFHWYGSIDTILTNRRYSEQPACGRLFRAVPYPCRYFSGGGESRDLSTLNISTPHLVPSIVTSILYCQDSGA